jgi:hypothetical protein
MLVCGSLSRQSCTTRLTPEARSAHMRLIRKTNTRPRERRLSVPDAQGWAARRPSFLASRKALRPLLAGIPEALLPAGICVVPAEARPWSSAGPDEAAAAPAATAPPAGHQYAGQTKSRIGDILVSLVSG